jgi:hypothetical protein
MEKPEGLSPELAEQMGRAEELAADADLLRAFDAAARDEDVWRKAEGRPDEFLREFGVSVPEELKVKFVLNPGGYPGPDFEFFTIRFTRCRTYWVEKRNEPGYEQETICFGIEIIPAHFSPIG